MEHQQKKKIRVFTIGHSTRPIQEFVGLLQSNGIRQLIDIRTIPKSRRNPQFNSENLAASLHAASIGYIHLKGLGALRKPLSDSANTGWRNASFRAYADYMQTHEFEAALDRAIALAQREPTAVMCAEGLPWQCHRSLVADALVVRGIEVREIVGNSPANEHTLTPFARVTGTQVTYPKDGNDAQMSLIKDSANLNSKEIS
jgi:uncharacterized protein (DUF488 family)